jgi:hypothetical protein
MRQYGEVPPWLAANNTPAVVSATGLGTGGGAGISTPDSSGFGDINVQVGKNYSTSWNIVLNFPLFVVTFFVAAEDAFGTITQSTAGNQLTISGTGAHFAGAGNGKLFKIHYEWSVSK